MKLSRRAALISTTAALLAPRTAGAQTGGALPRDAVTGRLAAFDDFVVQAMKRTGVPGVSVAIVHDDQVVHLKGYGVRRAAGPEPVDPDTVFQLASMSKPIASTVVAALAGDGRLTWDDPIVRHDPAFAMHGAWVTREVTLRDMFCHRSGLPDHAGDLLEDIGYDRAEVLHRLRFVRPDSSFRSHSAYTNFGLTAAAVAAAKASGKSWEDISAERLYRPLGMSRTSSRFADFIAAPNRAVGHVRDGNAWVARYTRDPDAQSPAGGVSSSARDMAQWLRLQLGRGSVDGGQIVAAQPLDDTHRPQIVNRPAANPMADRSGFYGLGWDISYDDPDRIRWGHSGAFNLGAATCVNVLPIQRIGIVALTNASPVGLPEAICRGFLDLCLVGKIEKDWVSLFGGVMAKIMAPDYGTSVDYAKPPAQAPALPVSAYIGRYENALYGPIEVAAASALMRELGVLTLKLGPKQESFALRHFARDVFTYQPVGENAYGPSAVTFTVGAGGKATAVTIEILDRNRQGTFGRSSN